MEFKEFIQKKRVFRSIKMYILRHENFFLKQNLILRNIKNIMVHEIRTRKNVNYNNILTLLIRNNHFCYTTNIIAIPFIVLTIRK